MGEAFKGTVRRAVQDPGTIHIQRRPVTLARYVGVACAGVAALVLLRLIDFESLAGFSFTSLIPESLPIPLLFATLGAAAVLASVVLYLVLSDK